jgi:hypothetical protein
MCTYQFDKVYLSNLQNSSVDVKKVTYLLIIIILIIDNFYEKYINIIYAYLYFSQYTPTLQVHVKYIIWSKHVAPCWHGFDAQSSQSGKYLHTKCEQ